MIEHFLTNRDYIIFLDSIFMREALINIIDNSIRAVKQNSRLRNKRIFIAVREIRPDSTLKIEITDNGRDCSESTGLPPEDV